MEIRERIKSIQRKCVDTKNCGKEKKGVAWEEIKTKNTKTKAIYNENEDKEQEYEGNIIVKKKLTSERITTDGNVNKRYLNRRKGT